MATDSEFFKSLGVTPPDDEGWGNNGISSKEQATRAFDEIISMCGHIRSEAIRNMFSAEEAYDFAMSYYTMFLSMNFQVAYNAHRGNDEDEEQKGKF